MYTMKDIKWFSNIVLQLVCCEQWKLYLSCFLLTSYLESSSSCVKIWIKVRLSWSIFNLLLPYFYTVVQNYIFYKDNPKITYFYDCSYFPNNFISHYWFGLLNYFSLESRHELLHFIKMATDLAIYSIKTILTTFFCSK